MFDMRALMVFWRVVCAMIALSLVGLFFTMACAYGKRYHKRVYVLEKRYYSDNCVGLQYNNGTFCIKNLEENRITIDKVDWAVRSWGKDTLGVFSLGNQRGYFNCLTGKIAIPLQYEKAWIFSEGLACVLKDGKLSFINVKGETAFLSQYPYYVEYAKQTDFVFRNGTCAMYDSTGKCGLINRSGEWVLSPRYDYINKPLAGFRIFKQDRLFGVLGDSLQVLLPPKYEWIDILSTGFVVRDKYNNQQLIAYDGKTVLNPLIYFSVEPLCFTSGYDENGAEIQTLSEYLMYRVCNSYGLMDKNGKPITRAIYSTIRALPNNLFYCDLEDPQYSVVINNKGELIK